MASKRLRLLLALVYCVVVASAAVWVLPRTGATVPLLMVALGVPLMFRLVPRNYFYGMRSPRTLWTTEEAWYRQNIITGVVMVGGGLIWLVVPAVRTAR